MLMQNCSTSTQKWPVDTAVWVRARLILLSCVSLKLEATVFNFYADRKKNNVKEIRRIRDWSMFIPDCVQMKSYPRSNAGTPQFQNLSGSVVSCVTGGRQGSGRRSSGGGGVTNDRSSATSITFGAGNKLCNNSSSRYGYCAFFKQLLIFEKSEAGLHPWSWSLYFGQVMNIIKPLHHKGS